MNVILKQTGECLSLTARGLVYGHLIRRHPAGNTRNGIVEKHSLVDPKEIDEAIAELKAEGAIVQHGDELVAVPEWL